MRRLRDRANWVNNTTVTHCQEEKNKPSINTEGSNDQKKRKKNREITENRPASRISKIVPKGMENLVESGDDEDDEDEEY